jgi:hypothetical protein
MRHDAGVPQAVPLAALGGPTIEEIREGDCHSVCVFFGLDWVAEVIARVVGTSPTAGHIAINCPKFHGKRGVQIYNIGMIMPNKHAQVY